MPAPQRYDSLFTIIHIWCAFPRALVHVVGRLTEWGRDREWVRERDITTTMTIWWGFNSGRPSSVICATARARALRCLRSGAAKVFNFNYYLPGDVPAIGCTQRIRGRIAWNCPPHEHRSPDITIHTPSSSRRAQCVRAATPLFVTILLWDRR